MANSHDDLTIRTEDWTNVYSEMGITVGAALIIQNKNHGLLLAQICASKPSADSTSGIMINKMGILYVDAGESGLWVKAVEIFSVINVQEQ